MRTPTPSRRSRRLLGAVAALSLLGAACGDDDDGSPSAAAGTTVTASDTGPGDTDDTPATSAVPTDTAPSGAADVAERVVSLSPTHTEMLFAIGAGGQVVAVDEQSDFPAEALELPNDLSGFEPNVEAIASYEPDLVVIGGDFTGLGEQLDAIDIEWYDGPAAATLDDTYAQIDDLGELTGRTEEAAVLVQQMQDDIDDIVAGTDVPDDPLTLYHEIDPTYFSADSTTFVGELYALLGLQNIADGAEGDSGGFPQLSAEFIVSADPDMVFLADTECCDESADTVAARDGWAGMTAVVDGNVFEMSDDLAARWGPRVVDYLADVSAAVEQVTTGS